MWNGFIGKQIRRSDRNILLASLVLLALALTIWIVVQGYWYNYLYVVVLGIIALAVGVWNLQEVVRRWNKPQLHPIVKCLTKFGHTPEVIAAQIDAEVELGNKKPLLRSGTMTSSWLLKQECFGLKFTRLEQIVWIYQKITHNRINGVIPIGKTFAVVVCDRHGQSLEIPGRKTAVISAIEELSRQVPWAIVGFDGELEKLWDSNRDEIIEIVDRRRQ